MPLKIIWKTAKYKSYTYAVSAAYVGKHEVCRMTLEEIHGRRYWATKLALPGLGYLGNPYHNYRDKGKAKKWAEEQITKWFEEAMGG